MLYETILGEAFKQLHPKLQQRYTDTFNKKLLFKGEMVVAEVHPLLKPVALAYKSHAFLLSKGGKNVPFEITLTTTQKTNSIYEVFWERTFFYEDHNRYFHSTMVFDLEKMHVTDYLGEPSVIKAPLQFNVTNDGHLFMRSTAIQQLLFGPLSIPIPSIGAAKAFVDEGYDEHKQKYTIHLSTSNPILGNLMRYMGEFTIEEIPN